MIVLKVSTENIVKLYDSKFSTKINRYLQLFCLLIILHQCVSLSWQFCELFYFVFSIIRVNIWQKKVPHIWQIDLSRSMLNKACLRASSIYARTRTCVCLYMFVYIRTDHSEGISFAWQISAVEPCLHHAAAGPRTRVGRIPKAGSGPGHVTRTGQSDVHSLF